MWLLSTPYTVVTNSLRFARLQAHTAYGGLSDVPGGCDILVAGTSCVDFSTLNNSRKEIDGSGESAQTFRGMMDWVQKTQCPIVILENVYGAPFDKFVQYFEDPKVGCGGYHCTFIKVSERSERNGYRHNEATYISSTTSTTKLTLFHSIRFAPSSLRSEQLDTKDFYIPHTRQRGYVMAVKGDRVDHKVCEEWVDLVKALKRPASGGLDAFMFRSDDPRVIRGRKRMSEGMSDGGDSNGKQVSKVVK